MAVTKADHLKEWSQDEYWLHVHVHDFKKVYILHAQKPWPTVINQTNLI